MQLALGWVVREVADLGKVPFLLLLPPPSTSPDIWATLICFLTFLHCADLLPKEDWEKSSPSPTVSFSHCLFKQTRNNLAESPTLSGLGQELHHGGRRGPKELSLSFRVWQRQWSQQNCQAVELVVLSLVKVIASELICAFCVWRHSQKGAWNLRQYCIISATALFCGHYWMAFAEHGVQQ